MRNALMAVLLGTTLITTAAPTFAWSRPAEDRWTAHKREQERQRRVDWERWKNRRAEDRSTKPAQDGWAKRKEEQRQRERRLAEARRQPRYEELDEKRRLEWKLEQYRRWAAEREKRFFPSK